MSAVTNTPQVIEATTLFGIDALSDRRTDIDASCLRLTPGVFNNYVFPESINFCGFHYSRATPRLAPDGELLAVHYTAMSSIGPVLLVVWND